MSLFVRTPKSLVDVLAAMTETLHVAGLFPEKILVDGELHRCPVEGKPKGTDGSYVAHLDAPATLWWQNFRTQKTGTWTFKEERELTNAEQQAFLNRKESARRIRQEEESKRYAVACEKARSILAKAPDCKAHPYLDRKGVKPCADLKCSGECLVVPVLGMDGKLMTLQFITAAGEKRFLSGGRTRGGYFAITGNQGRLFICEGLATGLSLYQATGQTVLCAFAAGNLSAVAAEVRRRYPAREITLCADNDHASTTNIGLSKATAVAAEINAQLAVPEFKNPDGKSDFNDLHKAEGLDVVRKQLVCAPKSESKVGQAAEDMATEAVTVPVSFDTPELPTVDPASLPRLLGDFCGTVAEGLQVPFELVLINALACVAVAGQRKFKVQVRAGYTEPVNIYAMAALPPGERKSATVEACKRPLMAWEAAAQEEAQVAINNAQSERKTLEKAIEATRSKASKATSAEDRIKVVNEVKELEAALPKIPSVPRLLIDDVTPEAIPPFMEAHGEQAGIIEAEGGLFDVLAGRYSGGIPNLDAVLKLWSGEEVHVDRRSAPPIVLHDPALTICLTPQPEIIRGMADKPGFRGRGLVGRFLFLLPRSRVGNRDVDPQPISPALQELYAAKIHSLLSLPWALDPVGKPTAFLLQIAPDAYLAWLDFYRSVEESLRPGGELELIADWGGKLHGAAIRLSGLLHLVTHDDPQLRPIDLETMRQALTLSKMFTEHAKAAFNLMGTDPDIECAKQILAWIQDRRVEAFQAREAFEKIKGRYPKMVMVKAGLSILEERAYIFPEPLLEREPGKAGRSPSPGFKVNPLAHVRAA